MDILERLGLRKAIPPQRPGTPRTHVVVPQRGANLAKMTAGAFRNGMWVTLADDRVGILTDIYVSADPGPTVALANVMLTQDDGTNLLQVQVPVDTLRQATRLEIPQARRPAKDAARRMGYAT